MVRSTSLDEISAQGGRLALLARCAVDRNPVAAEAVAVAISKAFGDVVLQRDALLDVVNAMIDSLRRHGAPVLAAEVQAARDSAMDTESLTGQGRSEGGG